MAWSKKNQFALSHFHSLLNQTYEKSIVNATLACEKFQCKLKLRILSTKV